MALATVALAFAACGAEEEGPEAEGAPPEPATTQSAPQTGTTCTLPEAFPAELPMVPGCFSVADHSMGGLVVAVASTTVSGEEARAFLEEQLPAEGWTIERREDNPDGVHSLYITGHGASAVVEIQPPVSPDSEAIGINYVLR